MSNPEDCEPAAREAVLVKALKTLILAYSDSGNLDEGLEGVSAFVREVYAGTSPAAAALMTALEPERLAQAFHEAYEELAPRFGYKTRDASAVPWADVPKNNKELMIATARRVARAAIAPEEESA